MAGKLFWRMEPFDWLELTFELTMEEEAAFLRICNHVARQGPGVVYHKYLLVSLFRCGLRKAKKIFNRLENEGLVWVHNNEIRIIEMIKFHQDTQSSRSQIPQALRDYIFERDQATCVYCGETSGPLHLDHMMPVSRGGHDTESNLAVACRGCNLSKGSKTPEEWLR